MTDTISKANDFGRNWQIAVSDLVITDEEFDKIVSACFYAENGVSMDDNIALSKKAVEAVDHFYDDIKARMDRKSAGSSPSQQDLDSFRRIEELRERTHELAFLMVMPGIYWTPPTCHIGSQFAEYNYYEGVVACLDHIGKTATSREKKAVHTVKKNWVLLDTPRTSYEIAPGLPDGCHEQPDSSGFNAVYGGSSCFGGLARRNALECATVLSNYVGRPFLVAVTTNNIICADQYAVIQKP